MVPPGLAMVSRLGAAPGPPPNRRTMPRFYFDLRRAPSTSVPPRAETPWTPAVGHLASVSTSPLAAHGRRRAARPSDERHAPAAHADARRAPAALGLRALGGPGARLGHRTLAPASTWSRPARRERMVPPGLAMVAFSPRAWEAVETATMPRFYFDAALHRDAPPRARRPGRRRSASASSSTWPSSSSRPRATRRSSRATRLRRRGARRPHGAGLPAVGGSRVRLEHRDRGLAARGRRMVGAHQGAAGRGTWCSPAARAT